MNKRSKNIVSVIWLLVFLAGLLWVITQSIPTILGTKVDKEIINKDSFGTRIEGCYYRLGDKIYCGNLDMTLPSGIDIGTFKVLSHIVAKDKNHVYVLDKIYPSLDVQTFNKFTKAGLNLSDLFVDKNGIYKLNSNNKLELLSLDIDTVENIDSLYIRDKNSIFFTGNYSVKKVNGADSKTFHVLGVCASVEASHAEYAADKNNVYVGDTIVPNIDPVYFVQLARIHNEEGEMPFSLYLWKDSKNIYVYCGTSIKEADYNTFEYLNGRAQDKNNYYDFNTGGGGYTVSPKK